MHFQQRKMKYDSKILEEEKFKIVPNSFLTLENEKIDEKNFKKIKKHIICFHTLSKQFEFKRKGLKRRINNLINK